MSLIPDKTKKRAYYQSRPTQPNAKRLFDLPEQNKQQLSMLADKQCWKCKGAGYAGWNARGTSVNVCQCVRDRIPAMEEAAEALRIRTEEALARAKEEAERARIAAAKLERMNKIRHYTKVGVIGTAVLAGPPLLIYGILRLAHFLID